MSQRRRVDTLEEASTVSLALSPKTVARIDLSDLGDDRGVPVWAYKAARRAVDEWVDGRAAGWRVDALAWHTARYLLDEQARVQEQSS